MQNVVLALCSLISFVQSGSIDEDFRHFDFYWRDYSFGEEVHRTYAISIAKNPGYANIVAPNIDLYKLPKCDTFITLDNQLVGVLALTQSVWDYERVNYLGIPFCPRADYGVK